MPPRAEPQTGRGGARRPSSFELASQRNLHEAVARDSAERRVAGAIRLQEELHVEAVPRLRERPVRDEREVTQPSPPVICVCPWTTRGVARMNTRAPLTGRPPRAVTCTRAVIGAVLLLTGLG